MFYKILNFLEPGLHDVIYFDIMEELLIKQRPLLYIGVWRKKASDDHYETIHLHLDINKTTESKSQKSKLRIKIQDSKFKMQY